MVAAAGAPPWLSFLEVVLVVLTVSGRSSVGGSVPGSRIYCFVSRIHCFHSEKSGQLQKSVDALGGGLTKYIAQAVYEERKIRHSSHL